MLSHIRSQGTFVSSSGVYHSQYVLSWHRSSIRTIILIGRQWRLVAIRNRLTEPV